MSASDQQPVDEASCAPTRADLIRAALCGVAMIEDHGVPGHDAAVGSNIRGTAFAADERGYFLTAKHVVRGLTPAQMELRTTYSRSGDGTYAMAACRSVEGIYAHPFLDVAVVAVPSSFARGRVRLPMDPLRPALGDEIVLLGFAHGTELVFADDLLGAGSPKSFSPVALGGMVCARIPDDGRPPLLYAYDCSTFPGCSGGPILSTAGGGSFLGVHLRGFGSRVGYAAPIGDCLAFVRAVATVHEAWREEQRLQRAAARAWPLPEPDERRST